MKDPKAAPESPSTTFDSISDNLSNVQDEEYRQEWGKPKTGRRLKKIVQSIAAFCTNVAKNPFDTSSAEKAWKQDLAYMKRMFYDRWGDFPWPDVPAKLSETNGGYLFPNDDLG
ncbi:MAG: hypothetical protein R6X33_00410 [Candidatus Brocadiia bacterium]